MLRRHYALCILLFALCALTGCRHQAPQYRVGFSQCLDDAWRRRMNDELQRELLLHPDLTLSTRVAHGSNELQCAQIDSFIAEGVDLLIVSPNEAVAIQPAVSRAHRAGIPVVVADRRVDGDEWTAFVGGDNLQVGHLLGARLTALAQEWGHPVYVFEIAGIVGSTPARLRHTGMLETIQNDPQVNYMGYAVGRWFEEPAYRVADSVLRVHPQINVVVAQNDLMAMGVSRAAREQARDIYIIGVDALGGPDDGLQAIIDGKIDASATYLSRGDMVVQTAAQILHGEPYVRDTVLETYMVDRETAEMMLRAEQRKDHEVESIRSLESRLTNVLSEYQMQRAFIYVLSLLSVLLVLLVGVVVYVMRYRLRVRVERQKQEDRIRHQAEQLQSITEELARTKAQIAEEEFVSRLKVVIEEHLNDPELDIDSLSEKLGLSRTSLYRKIKQATGYSPVELVRHIRLEKANLLLQESDLTVQQIAYDVGFSSPGYFSKCYKHEFGIAPADVDRKQKRK